MLHIQTCRNGLNPKNSKLQSQKFNPIEFKTLEFQGFCWPTSWLLNRLLSKFDRNFVNIILSAIVNCKKKENHQQQKPNNKQTNKTKNKTTKQESFPVQLHD